LFIYSLREQYIVDLCSYFAAIIYYIYLISNMVDSKRDLKSKYSTIAYLNSQPSTPANDALIASDYQDLKDIGDNWHYYFRVLVIL